MIKVVFGDHVDVLSNFLYNMEGVTTRGKKLLMKFVESVYFLNTLQMRYIDSCTDTIINTCKQAYLYEYFPTTNPTNLEINKITTSTWFTAKMDNV